MNGENTVHSLEYLALFRFQDICYTEISKALQTTKTSFIQTSTVKKPLSKLSFQNCEILFVEGPLGVMIATFATKVFTIEEDASRKHKTFG
jgi:hypothetical protein